MKNYFLFFLVLVALSCQKSVQDCTTEDHSCIVRSYSLFYCDDGTFEITWNEPSLIDNLTECQMYDLEEQVVSDENLFRSTHPTWVQEKLNSIKIKDLCDCK